MRILVTSSRFPHALGAIRHLGAEGHAVFAADTHANAPGSHSRFVRARFVTASPTFEARRYVAQVASLVREHGVELILPSFEEAHCLAAHRDAIPAPIFCADSDALLRLHDKARFVALSGELGLPVPRTLTARDPAELVRATSSLPEYAARPAFSRGGVSLLTNVGPLAGALPIEQCRPTVSEPWIVQEFVHGEEVCSFSIAQHGRLVAHSAYVHPKTIDHAGGIVFESIDDPESRSLARRYVEALGLHGTISLDFVRTRDGLVLLECNPRPTAGLLLLSARDFSDAVLGRVDPSRPRVAPPGVRRQIGAALLRDMVRDWREIPHDLRLLTSGAEDVYASADDPLPALYALLSYAQVRRFRRQEGRRRGRRTDLVAAQFYDVLWNGPASEPSEARVPEAPLAGSPLAGVPLAGSPLAGAPLAGVPLADAPGAAARAPSSVETPADRSRP